VYKGYDSDRFPERILETSKTGRASMELKSTPVASKELDIDMIISVSTSLDCKENKPVEATVVETTMSDPIAAVRTEKCRARADLWITSSELGVT